jgi:hypothetical protein
VEDGQQPPGEREPVDRAAARRSWRRAVDLSAVGIAFPIALIVGFVLGREVGEWLGYPVAGRVIGGLIGAAAGFRNLLLLANRRS